MQKQSLCQRFRKFVYLKTKKKKKKKNSDVTQEGLGDTTSSFVQTYSV